MKATFGNTAWSPTCQTAVVIALLLSPTATNTLAGVPKLDAIMDHDPSLPTQPTRRYLPQRWKALWRDALAGPEEDLRREAAAAILRAHQQGCPDLQDLADSLIAAMASSKNQTVRLTMASALIALDHREAAAPLFELVQSGGPMESMTIEPALGRWGFMPVRELWLARLSDPYGAPRRSLCMAIDGVRFVGEARAAEHLRRLAMNPSLPADIRLPAAQALGELQSEGLTEDARRIAEDTSRPGMINRLVAARLLATHQGGDAQQLLLQLAVDDQPVVAAIALRRLLQLDPELVKPLLPRLLNSPDAVVRQLAARSLVERPSVQVFPTLGELLADPHPDVRVYVRSSMRNLAKRPEFDEVIRNTAVEVLESDDWRGLEQAARLLAELDYKPAAPRLVELLYFERAEVHVTAAWSLRRLAVRESLPGMLDFAKHVTDKYPVQPGPHDHGKLSEGHDACLSHLFQAFGVMTYAESEPVLLKFVPRRYDLGPRSRGAACWALGHLHQNDPQPELMNLLGHRVADEGELPVPEPVEVRANAAVSLGRMNAKPALEVLRYFYKKDPPGDRIREACGWAIEQITGEDLPDPGTKWLPPPNPFLQPLDP